MTTIPIYQVDAFADAPFRGNPAAVCLLENEREADWMQAVAQEMNLAETAFVHPIPEGYSLRWFTPTTEVDLCGHATLATAHILWEEQRLPSHTPARFSTRSGRLVCERRDAEIWMDFPAEAPEETPILEGLAEALGISPVWAGRNRFDSLLEVESETIVRNLTPDFTALAASFAAQGVDWYRGVVVTARAENGPYDFVSRCFYPPAGIMEDPVTGSAHCCLGPYWRMRQGKDRFVAYQASKRGGVVKVEVRGDRVLLGGQAITILRGELTEDGATL